MKQGWEIKKLGDCFDYIRNGANIKQERGAGGIPITRIETLSGGIFNRNRLGYADIKDADKYKSHVLESEDLLLSHINSKTYIGRTVVYIKEGNEIIIHGMNLLRLKAIRSIISPFFMYYYSLSEMFGKQIANRRKDAVNQSSISVGDLKTVLIPVPSLAEQERIVAELDCLSSVIEKQKELLKELDNLAQSTFYTMFGDPITNEKGWEVKTFGGEFEISSGGTPSTSNKQYWENGNISWIGSNMCQNTIIYENDGKYITALGLEKSSAKLYEEDYVLVALVGATIGKTALLKKRTTTNQNIAGINVPKNKEYNSVFVFHLLQGLYCLFEDIGGDKFKMANLGFVRSLPLMSPPINLQQEFASKIEAIEKQKELIKQSIAETETLFNSRMDYYFN